MGDRGNIEIAQPCTGLERGETSIFLYTHWRGSELCKILATALDKGRDRWADPAYMTRIIFNELQGDDRSNTGFGISIEEVDPEYPTPQLFWTTRTTKFGTPAPEHPQVWHGTEFYTADEFILHFLAPRDDYYDLEPTLEIPVIQ
jgi:hypothetical protein|tara:strand:- start:913 stop:1347 length:435 start_codon:yes stop_codon:yes gene_type:complete